MHVLILTTVHRPSDARIVHREMRSLLDGGHTVTYAAAFTERGQPPPDGVIPIDLPAAHGRRRLRALRAARRLLANPPPGVQLTLLHDPELLLALATTRGGRPVVWDVHEDLQASLEDRTWLPTPLKRPARAVVARVERWAERRCDLMLAEAAYQDRFERQHHVVPNLPWRRAWQSQTPQARVVYIGRVSAGRGAHELVEVGRRLQTENIDVVVVGPAEPEVRPLLEEAEAAGALRWHGFMPNPEAMHLLDGALAGLSLLRDEPNYRHSMPTKVLEYMERGLPVITTALPLARNIVERHDCGIVVPFGDPEAAAAAVLQLRQDEPQRAAMACRAREAAVAYYCWDDAAPDFIAALKSAACL